MYEDLIVSAMPRARTMAVKYRGSLDPDEAISLAWFTLVEIAPRFDPTRGVKFNTFASSRIIGAIKDKQREKDGLTFVPRGTNVEHLQILENVATCRRNHADYRPLKRALDELPVRHRRLILTYVVHSYGRGVHRKSASETPQGILGMKEVTFHWYRKRILVALRTALEARGVRKVSDIL